MAPKVKINFKERLEDGELDLSLSDLQEVPVRDIALLKKATSLDLSNNRLIHLGKNFTTLKSIVKLDLSKNQLIELPEDFGELKQLKHLDLYSNSLTHIPLSFHQLKSLRWLDLKNNPLIPAVAKVAGPCLDAQQCAQCARSVVTFFTQMNDQVETVKAKRELQRQAALEAQLAEQKILKKKNKKKVKKDKKTKGKTEKNLDNHQAVPVKYFSHREFVKKNKKTSKVLKSYVLIFNYLLFASVFSIVSLFMFSALKIPSSIVLKKYIVNLWEKTTKSVPSSWNPWVVKFEDYVENLHGLTGKSLERVFIDERVQATAQFFWDMVVFIGTKSKRFLISLGDQAIIWTSEIKKCLKL